MYKAEKIQISFTDRKHGWILMKLNLPEKMISVYLSNVFDPFPDLLDWLEKICHNDLPAALTIDEEGYGKKFVALKVPKDATNSILLKIYEWGKTRRDRLLAKSELSKYNFVKTVLNTLQSFSEKETEISWRNDYKLCELPFETVRSSLNQATKKT